MPCTELAALALRYPRDLTPIDAGTMALGELAEAYNNVLSEKDAAKLLLRRIDAAESALRAILRDKLNEAGIEKFTGAGITISVEDKEVAAIDDTKWDEIMAQLIADGESHLIQRRITGSRLSDLITSGYALPEGLSLTSFPTIKHRRTSS